MKHSGAGTAQTFYVRQAGAGTTQTYSGAISSFTNAPNDGDWLRIQFVMNFTANSGAGSGALSWEDLTRGDTSFTAVGGMTALSLGLTTTGVAPPSAWNMICTRVDTDASDVTKTAFDNLNPNVNAVPEPGTLALLASGLIGLLCYAWRKRK